MDRAAAQAARLDDLVWDADKKLKKVTEDSKVIQKTQKRILGVQELVQRVEAQLGTLKTREETVTRDGKGLEKRLRELRDEIDAGFERFEVERRGMDTVNTQVLSLRSALSDFEARRADIENATRDMAGATKWADELTARLATLAEGIGRVDEQAERVHALRSVLERAEASTARVRERVQELEDARPSLDLMATDVVNLHKAHDEVVETLDRLKESRAEMERSHAAQVDARSWLTQTQTQLGELQTQVVDMDLTAARIDETRAVLDDLTMRSDVLEDRKHLLSSVEERLDDLGALSNTLDERMRVMEARRAAITELEEHARGLNDRLDDADRRFKQVAARADEAGQVEERFAALAQRVDATEGQIQQVEATVTAAGRRAATPSRLWTEAPRVSDRAQ